MGKKMVSHTDIDAQNPINRRYIAEAITAADYADDQVLLANVYIYIYYILYMYVCMHVCIM